MATLSELLAKVDKTAKAGDRERALKMLDNLLKKVPKSKAQPILKRQDLYKKELDIDVRIKALEEKYGV